MNNLKETIIKYTSRRFFKFGLPFLVFMVGGSFGLKEFASLRYEYRRSIPVLDMAKEKGLVTKEKGEVTLESEYEKIKKMDIDNWTNIRGPRPWEEPTLKAETK